MKKIVFKIIQKMLITLLSFIIILVVAYFLFVAYYPTFGGDVTKERQKLYTTSKQFKNGTFLNEDKNVPKKLNFGDILKISQKFFFTTVENDTPKTNIRVQKTDSASLAGYQGATRFIWFGHSAFLMQSESKNILLDPMFGEVAAPHPLLGSKRFNSEIPITIEKMPAIDAVIISHDHYDHLDYESIKKLKRKTKHFFVPLGVGVHLETWGVEKNKITEMDWWEETQYEDFTFICTPSQHFSGRKMNNRQSTLWSSWVIKTPNDNIYFSGDSGYGKHFTEIGKKYGPFDFAMLECGQYNKMWSDIHMMPEETAQAGLDLKAQKIMPIHWGAFKLAMHSWTDPIERVSKKAKELNIKLIAPRIGNPILAKEDTFYTEKWWDNY